MDPIAALITVVAGVAMGWINNVAGGAGIFALWAFEYACGLPIESANPTARVAAVAIGMGSFIGYLRAGRRAPAVAWLQGLFAVPGAVLGSQMALQLPEWAFRGYLAAVMALLLRQQLAPIDPTKATGRRPIWLAALGSLLIGLHMGFAQVGTGLVATFVLAAAYDRDLVAVNVAKSTIVIMTSIGSLTTFAMAGAIAWWPGLALAAGALTGSYAASHWSVAKGSNAVRRVVLGIAIVTLAEQLGRLLLLLVG